MPALLAQLDRVAAAVRPRNTAGPFRLPEDRMFTMPGFGAIVTGTMTSGKARIGDPQEAQGQITAADLRDLTGASRKYAVPILEYLDPIRFTRRISDARLHW